MVDRENNNTVSLWFLFFLVCIALIVWGGYWIFVINYVKVPEGGDLNQARGLFGDMFGGANALFSAIAFAGLIYTILLQRKELSLQRQELILTRTEYTRSAEAFVLKEAYDYVIRTAKSRKFIFDNLNKIKTINSESSLIQFQKAESNLYEEIREVANCYHYIGFLMKNELLTKKTAFFEEAGETMLMVWNEIKPIMDLEKTRSKRTTYKQYAYYMVAEFEKWQQSKRT